MIIPAMFAALMLVLILAIAGHHSEQDVVSRWEMTLNPEGLVVYSTIAEQIAGERWLAQTSYDDAARANLRGDLADALRFLNLGGAVVSDCSETLRSLLVNLAGLAARAAAIAPVAPLWPASFHAVRLMSLAGLHQIGHHLLVTTRQRLTLRLAVLRYGVRAATRLVIRSTGWLGQDPADSRRWHRVDELRGDLGALTDESLETLRVVLASLAAVPRPQPVRERKTA